MGDSPLVKAEPQLIQLGYTPALDGLRALGIALVVVHHGLQPLPFAGYIGVDIFFALSGFLITSILIAEVGHHGRVRLLRFYGRRAVRLYPALILAIIVVLPFGLLLRGWSHLIEAALAATYLTPVSGDLLGTAGLTWRHTWSLGLEEIFYLVWPLALILLLRRWAGRAWVITLGLGLALAAAQMLVMSSGQEASFFLRANGMFFGCSFALWRAGNGGARFGQWVGATGMAVLGLALVFGSWDALYLPAYLVAAAGTVAVIASIVAPSGDGGIITAALSSGSAVYLGKISYELYIWHYPVAVLAMLAVGSDRLIDVGWFAIPASAIFAVVAHHALAKPAVKWKARFS